MKKIALHWWIFLGVVAGALIGTALHLAYIEEARQQVVGTQYSRADLSENARAISEQLRTDLRATATYRAIDGIAQIFLKLLRMIVVPLVFFSLTAGILGLGDMRRLGRIGARTFGLYLLTSFLAVVTGLVMVNLLRPGVGTRLTMPAEGELRPVPESFWAVITNMIPDNPVAAAANFDLIGVIVFTLLFAIFLLAVDSVRRAPMVGIIEAGADVMMKMTHFVITLAPIGIAALIARMIATTGPEVFIDMARYVMTVISTLGIHLLITLPILVWLFTRRNPFRFFKVMLPAYLTAFSTASSSGTLGVTMERAENGAGVNKRVTSFVLPLGATVNMDGTALYEIVTVIFIAQLHSALDPTFTLTFGQQLLIVFLGLMVSIGAAGIPHAGLVMMVIILEAVGLPVAYTGIIWTVDRILDMSRTAVNVASDSVVSLIIAHGENEIDDTVLFNRNVEVIG
jgi:proton glutamate symport protein